ncbi:MAG TPA: hypothetical protein VGW30_00695 [Gaiellaceae bacterium]|nr:hypothetical protein [Gaiellaceae bacterium]
MSKRHLRRLSAALCALALVGGALLAAAMRDGGTTASGAEAGELPPALAKRLANIAFAPQGVQEGDRAYLDEQFMKHALPGSTISSSIIESSTDDWRTLRNRDGVSGHWKPLGPTWAKSQPNGFRDRGVYTANTTDFTGRIAHGVIDPNCGRRRGDDDDDDDDNGGGGSCRLWIANANGGVWRTNNALAREPEWKYLSDEFEHNNIGALELDPNDRRANTIWAGTGEGNQCGSGCETGVGLYKSRNGGESWIGPLGREAFYNRAVASVEVKPGSSDTIFAASSRAVRGVSNVCCRGTDSLIPGAPHYGLYRSTDGGRNWQLVNQGAPALCTANTPDEVAQNLTPCSGRGARRVRIDPVDPSTVYASFFAKGIWRSNANGAAGTWEQIMAPVGTTDAERAEFDIVELPSGETRMYAGVGGGGAFARLRRSDVVRTAPAATLLGSWLTLTSTTPDTPGYSSYGYCDPQCNYDNYVYAPATHAPNSGADHNTVYISGDNQYNENNWGPTSPRYTGEPPLPCQAVGNNVAVDGPPCGRGNGRGVALSTNGGEWFTDMTEDDSDDIFPGGLHPDHHALVVNPRNYRQFFDLGDGGIARSNGRFVDDSGDCVEPKRYTGTRLAFCQLTLSRVPERLTMLNKGLRALHLYQINYSPFDPDDIVGGTQDNGSWARGDEPRSGTNSDAPPANSFGPPRTDCTDHRVRPRSDGELVWVNTNVADGGHNNFDIGDSCFRQTAFQGGQMMVHYEPNNQLDGNWIADTLAILPASLGGYAFEGAPFVGSHINDPVHAHWLWTGREHVFRAVNQGRPAGMTKESHRENCNIWYGDNDVDENGVTQYPQDICDGWRPLGDPGPNGALTSTFYGPDRIFPPLPMLQQKHVAAIERAQDGGTVWAATNAGRIFVSRNADDATPSAVVFDRIDNDPTAASSPARYPTGIFIDPNDPNHAWISYSGFNAKTPGTPGHVFEVRYAPNATTFTALDGSGQIRDRLGDIPTTSITRTPDGTLYVGTDYGCVKSTGDGVWRECAKGLPRMLVSDLIYVKERRKIYAATHGQGVWELDLRRNDDN